MATRHSGNPRRSSRSAIARAWPVCLIVPIVLLVPAIFIAGCASPGAPTARKPVIPEAVSNLSAAQQGNHVLLTFAIPEYSAGGHQLEHPPTVEIFRDFEPAPSSGELRPASPKHPTLLVTIPSELVPRYSVNERFRYSESLQASDFTNHPDSIVVYSVRTHVADKKISAVSNLAALRIHPAPERIHDLTGNVTQTAVVLSWTAPQQTPVGPVLPLAGYRIYRGEAKAIPAANAGASGNSASALSETSKPATAPLPGLPAPPTELQSPLVKIGESTSPSYSDTQAEFGKTYVYSVRSVSHYSGANVESSDSNFLTITPRDTFPPAAPAGLVAVYLPAVSGAPAHVDLSWSVSPEPDVAGYQVYRSEDSFTQGTLVSNHLLLTPAFRDMNVVSGRSYRYTVTAVDRSGNESAPSPAASVMVPAANQPSHD